jgi:hypothetical protein
MGAIGNVVSGIFGGSGGQQVDQRTSTTTNSIDPMLKPYVEFGLGEARRLYDAPGPGYFPGQTYISPSSTTLSALQSAESRASAGSPLLRQAQSALGMNINAVNPSASQYSALYGNANTDPSQAFYQQLQGGQFANEALAGTRATAAGDYLGGNQFFQGAFNPAARAAQQSYYDAIQNVTSKAASAGRYGSGAYGQLTDRAGGTFANALTDVAGKLAYQNYGDERARQEAAQGRLGGLSQQDLSNRLAGATALTQGGQQQYANQLAATQGLAGVSASDRAAQLSALQAAPGMAEADYGDIQKLLSTGQAREGYSQTALQDQINRYNYEQNLPQAKLQSFLSGVYGAPSGGTSTSQQPIYSNPSQQAFGNLLGAAGTGALLYTAFSDIRTKQNIVNIGTGKHNLPIYMFDYKPEWKDEAGHGKFIGYMAHDVEKVVPQAVITRADGIQKINYALV